MQQSNIGLCVTLSPETWLRLSKYHNKAIRKQKHDRALNNSSSFHCNYIFIKVIPLDTSVGNEASSSRNNENFKLGLCHCLLTVSGRPDSGSALWAGLIARMWLVGVNSQRLKMLLVCALNVTVCQEGIMSRSTNWRHLSCSSVNNLSSGGGDARQWHICGFTLSYECVYMYWWSLTRKS